MSKGKEWIILQVKKFFSAFSTWNLYNLPPEVVYSHIDVARV